MRARLRMTSQQRKRLEEEVANYYKEEDFKITQRTFKLMFAILHFDFGFGHKRLSRILDAVTKMKQERDEDEVFWYHIDKVLIDHLGLLFDREDYEEMDK